MRTELPLPLTTIPKKPRASQIRDQPTTDTIASCIYTFKQKLYHWQFNTSRLLHLHIQAGCFSLLQEWFAVDPVFYWMTACLCVSLLLTEECEAAGACGPWWSLLALTSPLRPCWSYREKDKVMTQFLLRGIMAVQRSRCCALSERLRSKSCFTFCWWIGFVIKSSFTYVQNVSLCAHWSFMLQALFKST